MAFSVSSSVQQSEINVTPLIDVLLVLLIIFMVIVPVSPRGLESQVPRQSPGVAVRSADPVALRVLGGSDGDKVTYEVDGRVVAPAQLTAVLVQKLSMRAERGVYVTAAGGVSYREVAHAVSVAKAAGATAVALGRA
jgi:biopolymer transport protein ExbD